MTQFFPRTAFALLLGAFATSCTPMAPTPRTPPSGPPTPCNQGICIIKVTVNDCRAAGGIVLDKPFVSVDRANNMRWEIVTPGFEFDTNGIQFDPPNAQFRVQHSPRPNEFRLHNNKSTNGDFYYFVNVKGCLQMDPWVRNTN